MVFKSHHPETENEKPPVYKGTLSQALGAPESAKEPNGKERASILDSVLLSDTHGHA